MTPLGHFRRLWDPVRADRFWVLLIAALLVVRCILSGYLPITELSEARYAEVSRRILFTGDWITLWFLDDQPFWGKPPMAFWSVAVSYLVVGVGEFSSRLPSLIYTIATVVLVWRWLARLGMAQLGIRVAGIYGSLWLVIASAGSLITDPLLVLTTTMVMVGCYQAVAMRESRSAYLMWAGLGLGLLAKGPVALVICALACGPWVWLGGRWGPLFRYAHPISGLLLMLAISVPWYLAAEQATPGFLEYFIVGEHFERYTEAEWAGDPYGSVKDRPFGTIWLYFLMASLPWSLLVVSKTIRSPFRPFIDKLREDRAGFSIYLICWIAAPLMLFTPAQNVLITYVLPGLPAFAVLIAMHLPTLAGTATVQRMAAAGTVLLIIGIVGSYEAYFKHDRHNQKPILDRYLELNETDPGLLVYTGKPRFSVMFYGKERVRFGSEPLDYFHPAETVYFGVRDRWTIDLTSSLRSHCTIVTLRNDITLWHCPARGEP